MLTTIIIEDERLARDHLRNMLLRIDPTIQVLATPASVAEGIACLEQPVPADVIFSDVQLSDGLSFEIFRHSRIQAPVVFITAYDDFILNSFEYNGIDYLLKPVDERDLEKALQKYRMLRNHFSGKTSELNKLARYFDNRKRSRLVVKKGLENIALRVEEIVLFYTENKLVYVITQNGKKYLSDKNLGELELELDETVFFRVNRQYLVNINYIRGFKSYEKVKLQVDLSIPELNERCVIIVSQETAPAFRKWIYEA